MRDEYPLKLPPESTRQAKFPPTSMIDSHKNIVVDVVEAPKGLFTTIHIDHEAMALLPQELQDQLTPEKFLELVRLSVSTELNTKSNLSLTGEIKRILTAGTHGRALPNALVDFLVNGKLFSTSITSKGGLISGARYPISQNKSGIVQDLKLSFNTPHGLFGKKEAIRDIECSKQLINHGCYAALSFAYLEFDIDALHTFIDTYWGSVDSETANILHTAVAQVVQNGDVPVCLFRTGGTIRRNDYKRLQIYADFNAEEDVVTKRLVASEIRLAAKIWTAECKQNPQLLDYATKIDAEELENCLQKIEQRQLVTIAEFNTLQHFLYNLLLLDYRGVLATIKDNPQFTGILTCYFYGKDRDYSLKQYDFELAEKPYVVNSADYSTQVEHCKDSMAYLLSDYLTEISLICCPDYPSNFLTRKEILLDIQCYVRLAATNIRQLEREYIEIQKQKQKASAPPQ